MIDPPKIEVLIGRVVEIGDDETGQPRLTIHVTRDAVRSQTRNMIFQDVEIRLIEHPTVLPTRVGMVRGMKHGDRVKIVVTIEAELCSELDGDISEDRLVSMMRLDDAYGLKSIVVGKINPECETDHDTELLFRNSHISISAETKLKC